MELFEKNMKALAARAPDVAAWVAQNGSDDRVFPDRSADGQAHLAVRCDDGRRRKLYGERNRFEAPPQGCGEADYGVLFGLGPGRLAVRLAAELKAEAVLFIVEPNASVIRAALQTVDLSGPLLNRTLAFVPWDDQHLGKLQSALVRPLAAGKAFMHLDPDCRTYLTDDQLRRIEELMIRTRSRALDRKAAVRYSTEFVENEFHNLPLTLLSQNVQTLKNICCGAPAIVVSAGPSLNDCLPHLREAAGRALLVAAAPVLRVLQAHNIRPDVCGVLDFTPSNLEVFADVGAADDVPLVFLEAVLPAVVRRYQGPLISAVHPEGPMMSWLQAYHGPMEAWRGGRNVGSFCLDLAVFFGCDPIIMVGQDLSYPDMTTHAGGVIGRRRLATDQAGGIVELDAVGGGRVPSSLVLASYLQEIQETATRTDRTFVNTSPAGAVIPGTKEMSLPEALRVYCREYRRFEGLPLAGRETPVLQPTLEEIRGVNRELHLLEVVVDKALEIQGRLRDEYREKTADRREWERKLRVLNEYLAKINAYLRVFPPLRKYLLQSISENSSAPGPASGDGRSSFSAEMERIERILRSALPAVRRLADLVGQAGTRLGSILETRSRTQAGEDSVELHVTAGRAWAELGRLNEAWPHYRRALILNPDNEALVIEASGICAARERAPAARRLITDLRERVGGSAALDEAEQRLELRVRKWEARASEACEQGDMVTALLAARKLAAAEPENENARRIAGQAEAALHNRAPAVRNRAAPERTAETLGS